MTQVTYSSRIAGLWRCLASSFLLLGWGASAQTNCATGHPAAGAFVCYPNPSENSSDAAVPDIFHLSAQGNAAAGQAIAGYKILIDDRSLFENKLPVPIQNLSIEINLKSPFNAGLHTLQLVVYGVGSAEVKGLQFYPSKNPSFCEPFTRTDPRVCSLSPTRGPLQWSLTNAGSRAPADGGIGSYSAYFRLYGQNLKSVEADVADAVAVDAQGNLYAASHAFADVELRKYAPDGSLIYASLIHSCGEGFLSVSGLAIDNTGRAWIAGNTTACLPTTPEAVGQHVNDIGGMSGFIMLVDTSKPASSPPLYVTYLSNGSSPIAARIAAIRADSQGNAYVTGTTASLEFPHQALLDVGGSGQSHSTRIGFVSALNPSGSHLLWSTLLPNAQLTALALDGEGNIYLTGSVALRSCGPQEKLTSECDDVLVAEISDRGRRLTYSARFGGLAGDEGRAISTIAEDGWIFVAGDTDSLDFPTSSAAITSHDGSHSFLVGLQPCRMSALYSGILTEVDSHTAPGIALSPALEAFATSFSAGFDGRKLSASVQVAPSCATP